MDNKDDSVVDRLRQIVNELRDRPAEEIDFSSSMAIYTQYIGASSIIGMNCTDATNLLLAAQGSAGLWRVEVENPIYKIDQVLEWVEKKRRVTVVSFHCDVRFSPSPKDDTITSTAKWMYKVRDKDGDYEYVAQGDLMPWDSYRRDTPAYVYPPERK